MLPKRERRRELAVLLLILALILGGCQGNQTAITETKPAVPQATEAQQALPSQQVAEVPTAVPSPTEPPADFLS